MQRAQMFTNRGHLARFIIGSWCHLVAKHAKAPCAQHHLWIVLGWCFHRGSALTGEDRWRLTGICWGRGAWPCPVAAGTGAPPWFSAAIAPFRSPTRQVICKKEHLGRRHVVSGVYGRRREARGEGRRAVNVAGDSDGQRAPFSDSTC